MPQHTLVVSGARSQIGKTTLALKLGQLLPGSCVIKIGHGRRKAHLNNFFYPHGTSYNTIKANHAKSPWLIIESNGILGELKPDLCVYLTGDGVIQGSGEAKPSALYARQRAHLVSGTLAAAKVLEAACVRTGLPPDMIRRITWLCGARPEPATAIIMAGGKSRRMGSDKVRLKIDGLPLVERLYQMLYPFFDEVLISGQSGDVSVRGLREVEDIQPGLGPLMGIYSALLASRTRVNFVMACDIPEISSDVLWELLSNSGEHQIILSSVKAGFAEPLLGVYNRDVYPVIKTMLNKGERKISSVFPHCKTKIVEFLNNQWYHNLNTPHDFKAYCGLRETIDHVR